MNIWNIFTRGKNWLDLPRLHRTSWDSGFNVLDGSDSFSGFPSPQSGSYSALMQSVVAKTSSSEMANNNQVLPDNNLQSVPNINSRPVTRQDELSRPNSTVNYSGLPGFHHPGADTAQGQYNSTCHGLYKAVVLHDDESETGELSANHNMENLDPLVQRAIAAATSVPDLRDRYDKIPDYVETKLLPFQRDDILVVLSQSGGSNRGGFNIVSPPSVKNNIHLNGLFNIISYDMVEKLQSTLMESAFKVVIVDESHFPKNAQAQA
ncbi:hypothetical protein KIW84_021994 [Lathyrus oleraceus]|uniref:Uncharacterized protein n=1 Tax=Pisum sativum TaxID=3888 RepID=A0A9D4YBE3_PEA|nr:hypothetical protein KIW84_021994 [Pisum sativum]